MKSTCIQQYVSQVTVSPAASYRGCGENEEPDHYAARIAFTGNSRVLGPVCIVAGAIMTLAGNYYGI